MDQDAKLDSIISQVASAPESAPAEQAPQAATEEIKTDVEGNAEQPKTEEVMFPKKAINAISRRDKQIGKQKAELAALRAELESLKTAQVKPQQANAVDPNAPREEDYAEKGYGQYLIDTAKYQIQKDLDAKQQQTQETTNQQKTTQEREAYFDQRMTVFAQKVQEHGKTIPDLGQVIHDNADFVDALSPEVQDLLAASDNAPLTFYTLARDGSLADLADMNPLQAAQVIAKAEMKAESLLKKPVSNAPKPLSSNKGSAPSTSLASKSPRDVVKWLES